MTSERRANRRAACPGRRSGFEGAAAGAYAGTPPGASVGNAPDAGDRRRIVVGGSRPQAALCGGLLEGSRQETIATNPKALVVEKIGEHIRLWLLSSRSPSREALAPGRVRLASAKGQRLLRWWDSGGSGPDGGPLPMHSRDDLLRAPPNLSASPYRCRGQPEGIARRVHGSS